MLISHIANGTFVAALSLKGVVASMNEKQHMTPEWQDANVFSQGQASDQNLSSAPYSPHHGYRFNQYQQHIGSSQEFHAPQLPYHFDPTSQTPPPAPGVWELDNLERLFQHADSIGTDEHDCNYYDPTQEDYTMSEQANRSLEEDLSGTDYSASSQRDETSLGDVREKTTVKPRKKRDRICEKHTDWTKSKDPAEVLLYLQRLYSVLGIDKTSEYNNKQRSAWGKRFRNLANERMAENLRSDDPICHHMVIDELRIIKQKIQNTDLRIGERRILADKLNKYWQLDDKSAYKRLLRQIKKNPEGVDMARSSDEKVIEMAAHLLTPRTYTQPNGITNSGKVKKRGESLQSPDADPTSDYGENIQSSDVHMFAPVDDYSWYIGP